jgi:hypothetical protein
MKPTALSCIRQSEGARSSYDSKSRCLPNSRESRGRPYRRGRQQLGNRRLGRRPASLHLRHSHPPMGIRHARSISLSLPLAFGLASANPATLANPTANKKGWATSPSLSFYSLLATHPLATPSEACCLPPQKRFCFISALCSSVRGHISRNMYHWSG